MGATAGRRVRFASGFGRRRAGRQRAEALGEDPHDGERDVRPLADHAFELAMADPQRPDVAVGHQRGNARLPGDHRHLPDDVAEYYEAAIRVLDAGVPDATAVQLRRTLEAAAGHFGMTDGPLVKRIEGLIESGHITVDFSKALDHVRKVGNVGAHAGGERVDQVTASRALRFTTQMLRNLFEIPAEERSREQSRDGTIASPISGWLSQVEVRALVSDYFQPQDVNRAIRVAWCESRFDPNSVDLRTGGVGLFHHLPRYWLERAANAGFPDADPTDPEASVAAAAWEVYHGGGWDVFGCRG